MWGIELHSYNNNIEANKINKIFKEFAKKCGLSVTFGSDSHGPTADRKRELGCIKSNFQGFKKESE